MYMSLYTVTAADEVILPTAAAVDRSVLHVKSMSTWAPLCIGPYHINSHNLLPICTQQRQYIYIGPYAQANVVDGSIIYVAGQIPLNPATMKIIDSLRIDENLGNLMLIVLFYDDWR